MFADAIAKTDSLSDAKRFTTIMKNVDSLTHWHFIEIKIADCDYRYCFRGANVTDEFWSKTTAFAEM